MTESADARTEALQAVLDRVNSYQEGAEPEQVKAKLDEALTEAGIDLDNAAKQKVVDHIVGDNGPLDASSL